MIHASQRVRGHVPFAIFNRTLNRAVVALLRIPAAHHLASHRLALITVTGRKSGRQFTLPVYYRQQGDTVRIAVAWAARKLWWRNLRAPGAPVAIRLRGRLCTGHALVEEASGGVVVTVTLDPGKTVGHE